MHAHKTYYIIISNACSYAYNNQIIDSEIRRRIKRIERQLRQCEIREKKKFCTEERRKQARVSELNWVREREKEKKTTRSRLK